MSSYIDNIFRAIGNAILDGNPVLNEELAKSKSIYDRRIFITFCAKICPKISKKYFKEVFAFSMLKIIEEKKKDVAIHFSKNIISIRKKFDDISSTSKIEGVLM